jgi:hypothetical protein
MATRHHTRFHLEIAAANHNPPSGAVDPVSILAMVTLLDTGASLFRREPGAARLDPPGTLRRLPGAIGSPAAVWVSSWKHNIAPSRRKKSQEVGSHGIL